MAPGGPLGRRRRLGRPKDAAAHRWPERAPTASSGPRARRETARPPGARREEFARRLRNVPRRANALLWAKLGAANCRGLNQPRWGFRRTPPSSPGLLTLPDASDQVTIC